MSEAGWGSERWGREEGEWTVKIAGTKRRKTACISGAGPAARAEDYLATLTWRAPGFRRPDDGSDCNNNNNNNHRINTTTNNNWAWWWEEEEESRIILLKGWERVLVYPPLCQVINSSWTCCFFDTPNKDNLEEKNDERLKIQKKILTTTRQLETSWGEREREEREKGEEYECIICVWWGWSPSS